VTARTPEELATLLEDALLLGNPAEVMDLFVEGALYAGVRGRSAVAAALLVHGPAGWAGRPDVLQARDLALHGLGRLGPAAVARREPDGGWRYAILTGARSVG
jgi:hypothetical protein